MGLSPLTGGFSVLSSSADVAMMNGTELVGEGGKSNSWYGHVMVLSAIFFSPRFCTLFCECSSVRLNNDDWVLTYESSYPGWICRANRCWEPNLPIETQRWSWTGIAEIIIALFFFFKGFFVGLLV